MGEGGEDFTLLPNGLSAAHVTPRTWINILALEGAGHRNDGALPQPKVENRPKSSLPRNAASPLSSLICHRRGATRGWGVGPLGKVSWAASISMCAFPDLLLWSSLAWEFGQGPWGSLAMFLDKNQGCTHSKHYSPWGQTVSVIVGLSVDQTKKSGRDRPISSTGS